MRSPNAIVFLKGPTFPSDLPVPGFNDGGLTHCKIMYTSVRSEANGMGWATDYPYAGINLLTRVKELTKTRRERRCSGRTELLGGSTD